MKLKIGIAVGIIDQHKGTRKTINRTAIVGFDNLMRTAIIKIPIDARGREYVDVKIEMPQPKTKCSKCDNVSEFHIAGDGCEVCYKGRMEYLHE